MIGLTVVSALFALASAPSRASVSFVTQWGSSGQGQGQFGGPNDLAVDPSGSVFVSDLFGSLAPRIQEFTGRPKRLYTVTYRWPNVVQNIPCGAIPGEFGRLTLNRWLARSSYVGREILLGDPNRKVDHWRVTGTYPALPPGNFVRLPLTLGDIYVDGNNPATFWKVLHFGVQNLYDPELDEWFELETFKHRPGKVTLPKGCGPG